MKSWRLVFRTFAELVSTKALIALEAALRTNDSRLIQGATTIPPPFPTVQDWPVEAADIVGWCGWQGDGLETVSEVEEYFARMCFDMDAALGEPAGCRWMLNFWDEEKREIAFPLFLDEVRLALSERLISGDPDA